MVRPLSYSASFMFDHYRLLYSVQGDDGYLFNINTVTGKLAEFCWMKPATVEFEVDQISRQTVELRRTKPRALECKVTPVAKLPKKSSWVTREPLPCAARAFHTLRSKTQPISEVMVYLKAKPNGLKVWFRQSPGPVTEWQAHSAAYGGSWMLMKLEHQSRTFRMWENRILSELVID